MFAVGQKVWVYSPPLRPLKATIRENLDYAYRCDFESGHVEWLAKSVFSEFNIFARPEEKAKLLERIHDDITTMAEYSDRLAGGADI